MERTGPLAMEMPIMHDGDRYEHVRDIGSGNFGVARLMRTRASGELVAVKYIDRGEKVLCSASPPLLSHLLFSRKQHLCLGDGERGSCCRSTRTCSGRSSTTGRCGTPTSSGSRRLSSRRLTLPSPWSTLREGSSSSASAAPGGSTRTRFPSTGRLSKLRPCCMDRWLTLSAWLLMCVQARFFFQQLISGVSYCHSMQVCHRDLKLENTLLDGSTAPRLKICDFGYSKSSVLHSQPKSTVGTPAYIAPEVLLKKEYDGKIADVWSCGVTLYVMLVGGYPFEDPEDPRNFKKTIQKILGVQYVIPDYVHISPDCRHLISRIFDANPETRITMPEIKSHPWFVKNLPADIMDDATTNSQYEEPDQPMQNMNEIMQILAEATIPAAGTRRMNQFLADSLDFDDDMEDLDSDLDIDIDSSGEIVYAM